MNLFGRDGVTHEKREIFAVAVAAFYGRRYEPPHEKPDARGAPRDALGCALSVRGVLYDAVFARSAASRLELRFDKADQRSSRFEQRGE